MSRGRAGVGGAGGPAAPMGVPTSAGDRLGVPLRACFAPLLTSLASASAMAARRRSRAVAEEAWDGAGAGAPPGPGAPPPGVLRAGDALAGRFRAVREGPRAMEDSASAAALRRRSSALSRRCSFTASLRGSCEASTRGR